MVVAKFNIDGLVDKPDIIGAVFGQTEGLLGDELDLRELQKGGKIGRIEIDVSQSGSKTYGKLLLPASLDRVETCILGAAVESVDRVGPFEAQFQVDKVEDTRASKRQKILERAKVLIKQLLATEIPDSKELAELVQSEVKSSEIVTYGPEQLPAGPDVAKSSELIIVEGRADVITLLKNDITNAIAVGGAASTIPKSIISLAGEKEVTVFVDGDRGGDLIIRALLNSIEIDYVTKAPDGKEVEELTRKEIIKSIRTKIPIDQYLGLDRNQKQQAANNRREQQQRDYNQNQRPDQQRTEQRPDLRQQEQRPQQQFHQGPRPMPIQAPREPAPRSDPMGDFEDVVEKRFPSAMGQSGPNDDDSAKGLGLSRLEPMSISPKPAAGEGLARPVLESALLATLATGLTELSGTLRSRLYAPDGNVIKEIPIRELLSTLQDARSTYAVVLDGVITQRLVELALDKGIKAIYGIKANPMPRRHPELILYTKEQGKID